MEFKYLIDVGIIKLWWKKGFIVMEKISNLKVNCFMLFKIIIWGYVF